MSSNRANNGWRNPVRRSRFPLVSRLLVACALCAMAARTTAAQSSVIEEFPVPTLSTTFGMVADTDGSVWYTSSFPAIVGHVSPRGHITEYRIPTTADALSGIVVGSDGNVWFGESSPGGRIGRMSRSGQNFQEFTVPESIHGVAYLTNPRYLVVGPDQNIWFTAGSDGFGQITSTGAITMHYLPPDCDGSGLQQYGNPYGMTVGSDGALWMVGQTSNSVYRFEIATERLDTFPLTACGSPFGLLATVTATPDGNVWATDFALPNLYRISPSGDVTTFPQPAPSFGITARGALFVTRLGGTHSISQVDPATGAVLNDYPIPTPGSLPENIVVDSAGNIWFNEQDGHNIARLSNQPLPCIDDLALSYQNQTLTLRIAVKSLSAGFWAGWLVTQQAVAPLWLQVIPEVSSEVLFDVPLANFPRIGPVAVITSLINGSARCGDVRAIDTGMP